MRLAIISAALLLPLNASAAEPPARPGGKSTPSICAKAGVQTAEGKGMPGLRRLDDMPAGNLHLAVQRDVDGCIEPAVVRQGSGLSGPQRR